MGRVNPFFWVKMSAIQITHCMGNITQVSIGYRLLPKIEVILPNANVIITECIGYYYNCWLVQPTSTRVFLTLHMGKSTARSGIFYYQVVILTVHVAVKFLAVRLL